MGKTIATISLRTPMPIDAFAIASQALAQLPVVERWDPDLQEHVGTPLSNERELLISNTEDGKGYTLFVKDDVELRSVFARGHFEVCWVDHD